MLLKLIKNEIIKLMKKPKTKVMIVLYILFITIIGIASYYDAKTAQERNSIDKRIERMEQQKVSINKDKEDKLKAAGLTEEQKQNILNTSKMQLDEMENGIKTAKEEKELEKDPNGWRKQLEQSIANNKKQLEDTTNSESKTSKETDKERLELSNKLNQYQLDNNIKPEQPDAFTAVKYINMIVEVLAQIFLVVALAVFASDIVSGECTPPTLKFVLVQPIKRSKVLFAKFITISIISILLIVGIEGIAFLVSGLVGGFGNLNMPVLYGTKYAIDNTHIQHGSYVLNAVIGSTKMTSQINVILGSLALQSLVVLATVAVVFMISTIVKSSMISMAVSAIGLIIFPVLTLAIPAVGKISHLLFFTYANTEAVITGKIAYSYRNINLTLTNSIIVLVCTIVISYVIAHVVFKKKDLTI